MSTTTAERQALESRHTASTRRKGTGEPSPQLLRIISVVSVLIILGAWELVTRVGLVGPLALPSPGAVVGALTEDPAAILADTWATLVRVAVGIVGGTLAGVLVGLAVSYRKEVRAAVILPIEALRPVPVVALIPLFIIWFGINDFGKYLLVGIGCFVVMVVATIEAVQLVPQGYVRAAQTLGATRRQIFGSVVIPAIVPPLAASVRVANALGFTLVVASEFMGAQEGLGFIMMTARRTLHTEQIIAATIVVSILAAVTDYLLRRLIVSQTLWVERA